MVVLCAFVGKRCEGALPLPRIGNASILPSTNQELRIRPLHRHRHFACLDMCSGLYCSQEQMRDQNRRRDCHGVPHHRTRRQHLFLRYILSRDTASVPPHKPARDDRECHLHCCHADKHLCVPYDVDSESHRRSQRRSKECPTPRSSPSKDICRGSAMARYNVHDNFAGLCRCSPCASGDSGSFRWRETP